MRVYIAIACIYVVARVIGVCVLELTFVLKQFRLNCYTYTCTKYVFGLLVRLRGSFPSLRCILNVTYVEQWKKFGKYEI